MCWLRTTKGVMCSATNLVDSGKAAESNRLADINHIARNLSITFVRKIEGHSLRCHEKSWRNTAISPKKVIELKFSVRKLGSTKA